MQSMSSRMASRVASAANPQWVSWCMSAARNQAVAELVPPSGVASVVLRWKKRCAHGDHVEAGDDVCVVEWAELHPYLPVSHSEVLKAPCSGKVVYSDESVDAEGRPNVGVSVVMDHAESPMSCGVVAGVPASQVVYGYGDNDDYSSANDDEAEYADDRCGLKKESSKRKSGSGSAKSSQL